MANIVKRSMSNVDKPIFTEKQLVALSQHTPAKYIKERSGRGGRSFKYVTGAYIQARLNEIFGWAWSFEVKESGFSPSKKSVYVLGRLTVVNPLTNQIMVAKEQFGSSEIKVSNGSELDFADDMKSAATDALKKCASLLGIAADIYADETTAGYIQEKVNAVVEYAKAKKAAEEVKDTAIEEEK